VTNLLKSGECQAFSSSWYNQNISFILSNIEYKRTTSLVNELYAIVFTSYRRMTYNI